MFSLGDPSENAEPSNNQSAENMDQESKFLFGCVYQEVSNLPYYLLFLGDFNFTNLEDLNFAILTNHHFSLRLNFANHVHWCWVF